MKIKFLKAQSAVEFGILAALIVLIVSVTLTPLGGKIYNIFQHASPQKTSNVSEINLAGLMSKSDYNELLENLNQLKNSSKEDVKKLADNINELLAAVGLINSGQNNALTSKEVNTLLDNIAETSGSLGSIVSHMAEGITLSTKETALINNIKRYINFSLKIDTEDKGIIQNINDTSITIKNNILSKTVPDEVLKYKGSPLKNTDLSDINVDKIFSENYVLTGESIQKDKQNAKNIYLLTQNIMNNYKISDVTFKEIQLIESEMKKIITLKNQ